MDYNAAKDQALAALKRSDIGKFPHILGAWRDVHWNESDDQGASADAQVNLTDPNSINLFPALLKRPEAVQTGAILREFGISLYRQASSDAQSKWTFKLCLPDKGQVDAVQGKLLSDKFETYRELTETFKTAMDRLVCLNVCNALLANGVPRGQSRNVNIFQWGATAEYANLNRFHSIKPLVFAYTDRQVAECPGRALAEMIVNEMKQVRESSVGAALQKVVVELFKACR